LPFHWISSSSLGITRDSVTPREDTAYFVLRSDRKPH
jgi:hypothetical protein